ncbi:hypothetical protein CVT25_014176 [Psilocybe cyanescens]|uniref:Uncharacterized protein n=1 Tax=Psilocybe cyanescens TaxID=93625 RepID=A0A409XUL5_PSICY|nr:hypothetical protein CVT25_014176 [Psilocybe cyanescens]
MTIALLHETIASELEPGRRRLTPVHFNGDGMHYLGRGGLHHGLVGRINDDDGVKIDRPTHEHERMHMARVEAKAGWATRQTRRVV